MPHNPESDMSINEHINDGFPFREVGELYRQSVIEGWSVDQFCAAYSALVTPPVPATAHIEAVSPAIEPFRPRVENSRMEAVVITQKSPGRSVSFDEFDFDVDIPEVTTFDFDDNQQGWAE